MTYEGARVKGNARFWIGVVAVVPNTAVERVHEGRLARENSHGQAAAEDLSVGREIRLDSEQRLTTAWMDAEPGHHFVEYQGGAGLRRDLTHALQEIDRTKTRMAALHGFDKYGSQFIRMSFDIGERFRRSVVE